MFIIVGCPDLTTSGPGEKDGAGGWWNQWCARRQSPGDGNDDQSIYIYLQSPGILYKVCKHSCQFWSFSVHIPSMFFNFRMKRAVATVIPLQNSLKETQMKIWRHQNRESKSPKKHKTNKVELPYIIQTKEGRHYRNSQTRRTRESEYFIDLISINHSEFGIVGGWPGICSWII